MSTEGKSPTMRQEPSRSFLHDGERWHAYEVHRPYDRRSSRALVFECQSALRVVRDYPAHWRTLTDEELWALSWQR
jgi:hypothetical protein